MSPCWLIWVVWALIIKCNMFYAFHTFYYIYLGKWCNTDASCDQLQQDSACNQNVHLVTPYQLINKQTAATIPFLLASSCLSKVSPRGPSLLLKPWLSTYTYYLTLEYNIIFHIRIRQDLTRLFYIPGKNLLAQSLTMAQSANLGTEIADS